MTLQVLLESVFTYNLNFVVYLGFLNITFFPYRPPLRFQAQVRSKLYVRVCESSIQTYQLGPSETPLNIISFLNLNSEISKGRGLLVMIKKL
jgi:hypothetical protein